MKSEEVLEEIKAFAKENKLQLTKYAPLIAEAKRRLGDWRKCPCHRDGKHFCGSQQCMADLAIDGVCKCNLFTKKGKISRNEKHD